MKEKEAPSSGTGRAAATKDENRAALTSGKKGKQKEEEAPPAKETAEGHEQNSNQDVKLSALTSLGSPKRRSITQGARV